MFDIFSYNLFWCRSDFSINEICRVDVEVNYLVEEIENKYSFDFEANNKNWQMLLEGIKTIAPYEGLRVTFYIKGFSRVLLTNIQLYKKQFGTYFEYNETNNLSSIKDSTNDLKIKYTKNNLISSIIDTDNVSYNYLYDEKNRLIKSFDSKNNIIEINHDDELNKKTMKSTSSSNKHMTTVSYLDSSDNIIKEVNSLGYVTNYLYDSKKRLIESTLPSGLRSKIEYDNFDNIIKSKSMLNGLENTVYFEYQNKELSRNYTTNNTFYDYSYFDNHLLKDVRINNQLITSYEYGGVINGVNQNNLLKKSYAANNYYTFDYDKDLLTSVNYNNNLKVSYKYDDLKNIIELIDHDNNIKKIYGYNNLGQVSSILDNYNYHIHYDYDNLGNIQKVVYSNKENRQSYDYNYLYEDDNKSSSVSYYNGSLYNGMDVITLNANYTSVNGNKPVEYPIISNTLKKAFVLDDDLNRFVFGSYAKNKTSLVYDLSLTNTGTMCFWVKPESKSEASIRTIFTSIMKNDNNEYISDLGLYINDKYRVYAKRNLNLGLTQGERLNIDSWNFIVIQWDNSRVSVKINDSPIKGYIYKSTNITNHKIMIGSSVSINSEEAINHFDGKIEMVSYTNKLLSDSSLNSIYNGGRLTSVVNQYDEELRLSKNIIKVYM